MLQPSPASSWFTSVKDIRSIDIRDCGLIDEPTIPVFNFDELRILFEGIDDEGLAL